MKHVWKCDFCSKTDSDSAVIKEHEVACYMNPLAKDCGSCANYIQQPYEMRWACKFGFDFGDDMTPPCSKWENKS